ncbi:hypothetical protein D3C86_821650 [compost metagenome]
MLAMDSRAPRLLSKYAQSLTTIASKLAPTEDHICLTEQPYANGRAFWVLHFSVSVVLIYLIKKINVIIFFVNNCLSVAFNP